jgi:hypothetical protein
MERGSSSGLAPEAAAKLLVLAIEEEEHLGDQTVHAVGGEGVILDRIAPCVAQALSVPGVQGLLAIKGLLSEQEAARLMSVAEAAGFGEALGLQTAVLLARRPLCDALFSRLQPALSVLYPGALGLNARWRVYRYSMGDTFEPHIDGSWPCSALASELNLDMDALGIARSHPVGNFILPSFFLYYLPSIVSLSISASAFSLPPSSIFLFFLNIPRFMSFF